MSGNAIVSLSKECPHAIGDGWRWFCNGTATDVDANGLYIEPRTRLQELFVQSKFWEITASSLARQYHDKASPKLAKAEKEAAQGRHREAFQIAESTRQELAELRGDAEHARQRAQETAQALESELARIETSPNADDRAALERWRRGGFPSYFDGQTKRRLMNVGQAQPANVQRAAAHDAEMERKAQAAIETLRKQLEGSKSE